MGSSDFVFIFFQVGNLIRLPCVKFIGHTMSFMAFLVLILISTMAESGLEIQKLSNFPEIYRRYTWFRSVKSTGDTLGSGQSNLQTIHLVQVSHIYRRYTLFRSVKSTDHTLGSGQSNLQTIHLVQGSQIYRRYTWFRSVKSTDDTLGSGQANLQTIHLVQVSQMSVCLFRCCFTSHWTLFLSYDGT